MRDITQELIDGIRNSDTTRGYRLVIKGWTDDVCGVVNIPPGVDGEKRLETINEYIRNNLVHPDLRDADTLSRRREDTYRGKTPYIYEATVFGADGKARPEHQIQAYIRDDGEKYECTAHLDYRALLGCHQCILDDGSYQIVERPDDPYPYICAFIRLPDLISDKWTTYGSGELAKYSRRYANGTIEYYDGDHGGLVKTVNPDGTEVEHHPTVREQVDDYAIELENVDPDELVEVPQSQYDKWCEIRDRWALAAGKRDAFITAHNAEDVNVAASSATTDELLRAGLDVLSCFGSTLYLQSAVLKELATRVNVQESAISKSPKVEV